MVAKVEAKDLKTVRELTGDRMPIIEGTEETMKDKQWAPLPSGFEMQVHRATVDKVCDELTGKSSGRLLPVEVQHLHIARISQVAAENGDELTGVTSDFRIDLHLKGRAANITSKLAERVDDKRIEFWQTA